MASHAEGFNTTAGAVFAHAEGINTTAGAQYSHAEGNGTIAASGAQHVQGKYNIAEGSGKYAHIVGNGTEDNARSDAHTLDWEGNAWYAGTVECSGIILTDTEDGTRRFLLQVTGGQIVLSEIVAQQTE